MSWIYEKPNQEISWKEIIENGITYPHPKSTKQELQQWIIQHAHLLQNMKDRWFEQQLMDVTNV